MAEPLESSAAREALADGGEAAFRWLVERYSPRLLRIAQGYAESQDDAEDLLQRAWVRIYQKRGGYRGEGSLLGWMASVVRSTCVSAGRSAHRHGRTPVDPDTRRDPARSPEQELVSAEIAAAVWGALDSLTARQRDVVVLRLIEGLSVRETASRLGCAEGTVNATLHAALARLQPLLENLR
ncbi:MAG TPA: sigma-70 family RNA polymerase sigma factor [Longimicrobium sp.]|jgi:RNA polymerase sigma-70 factor (ECF subfamily)